MPPAPGPAWVLLDTPDVDSSNPAARAQARAALALADLAVWVTTAQKYKDQAGVTFLDDVLALLFERIDVFNQHLARQAEAVEDVQQDYARRWPENARRFLVVPESHAGPGGLLPAAVLAPLREALEAAARTPRARRARDGRHALDRVGARVQAALTHVETRRNEVDSLRSRLRERVRKSLYNRLGSLPGHEEPFELQAAMVRVVGPRLQTSIGDYVSQGLRSASDAVGWALSRIGVTGPKPRDHRVEPMSERDRHDLIEARLVLEEARAAVLEFARKRGASGGFLANRFHAEVKRLHLPAGEDLAARLAAHLDERRRERLLPLIGRFESDLETFCGQNPHVVAAMKVVVPGFSALGSVAAAIFSIHSLAFLPGATEYLLMGIALPIYRSFEELLPPNLLRLADSLSREPFIRSSREGFVKARREIFLETASWIMGPVEEVLALPEMGETEIAARWRDLAAAWDAAYPDGVQET